MSPNEFSRAKVLDFHAAACADALQHYPDLPAEVLHYLASVQICEYPDISPMSSLHPDIFLKMLYHPARVLLVHGKCHPQELVGSVRNYIQIVTKENYYGIAPRAVSDELMKYYEQS